jgi:hypothetical protein
MEACRGFVCKHSSNLGIGVKSQSRPGIAGSYRSWRQSSSDRDSMNSRGTDRKLRGRNLSAT